MYLIKYKYPARSVGLHDDVYERRELEPDTLEEAKEIINSLKNDRDILDIRLFVEIPIE